MAAEYTLAFWNLENLFDIENAPADRRPDKVARAIRADIRGWTLARLDRKIAQLAAIIRQMNGGRGPDLLGVCEVENRFVLERLTAALAPLGRSYQIVHHDTNDQRGIDVAFLYDANLFRVEAVFDHFVMRRTATRDILQANFFTPKNRRLVLIGNHWPSRSGGELESAAYRAIAGETLAYFHQRIWEVLGKDTPVLAMGDFNDEPCDRSLVNYALALRSAAKVSNGFNPYFQNLMWPLLGNARGSFYFDNQPNLLDQFLADKNLIKKSGKIRALPESVQVLNFPEMTAKGEYPAPRPFGGMGKALDETGFSDHFPVEMKISEAA